MVSIYTFDDYRKYIEAFVKARKSPWGIWTKIAVAAGCKATYLNQVMKRKAELTPDHVLGISEFFELSSEETQFFLLILDYGRAATKKLKDYLIEKIRRLRKEQEAYAKKNISSVLEAGDLESHYYSSWYLSAIHVLLSIPQYKTTVKISERLQLPLELTKFALLQLKSHGLAKQERDRWIVSPEDIRLSKNSPLMVLHLQNWRNRAIQDSTYPFSDGLHFTGVHSISVQDALKIKRLFLDLIEKKQKIIAPSRKEELFCMNLDFFKV